MKPQLVCTLTDTVVEHLLAPSLVSTRLGVANRVRPQAGKEADTVSCCLPAPLPARRSRPTARKLLRVLLRVRDIRDLVLIKDAWLRLQRSKSKMRRDVCMSQIANTGLRRNGRTKFARLSYT